MGGRLFRENSLRKNLMIPAAHGQLGKTNLGRSGMDSGEMKCAVFNIGMVSGASAVYGWIRLAELVPTNEFSRPHPSWRAGIFKICVKKNLQQPKNALTLIPG